MNFFSSKVMYFEHVTLLVYLSLEIRLYFFTNLVKLICSLYGLLSFDDNIMYVSTMFFSIEKE